MTRDPPTSRDVLPLPCHDCGGPRTKAITGRRGGRKKVPLCPSCKGRKQTEGGTGQPPVPKHLQRALERTAPGRVFLQSFKQQ